MFPNTECQTDETKVAILMHFILESQNKTFFKTS